MNISYSFTFYFFKVLQHPAISLHGRQPDSDSANANVILMIAVSGSRYGVRDRMVAFELEASYWQLASLFTSWHPQLLPRIVWVGHCNDEPCLERQIAAMDSRACFPLRLSDLTY